MALDKNEGQASVAAVDRALTILTAFRDGDTTLTLAELAGRTGFHKSTILRLTGSLIAFSFLERNPDGGFRIGPGAWAVGSQFLGDLHYESNLRPILARIAEATEESASFYVPVGGAKPARMCLLRVDSIHALRDHIRVGDRLPFDQGAGGRLLRAYMEPIDEDAQVVSAGYYFSYGQRVREIGAIAAPVFGAQGRIAGALTLSAPTTRRDPSWFEGRIGMVVDAAAEATQAVSVRSGSRG